MASCLHFCIPTPFEKGSTLQGKNLLPMGTNSFLVEKTPFPEGRQTQPVLTELSPLKGYLFPLNVANLKII